MQIERPRRRALVRATASLALTLAAFPYTAIAQQDYPSHTVRVIAPQGPGGGVDLVGRLLAEELAKHLKQSFVMENIGGAGGSIAAADTAKAVPDGYTLMIAYVGTHGTNPAVRKNPYDAIKDFTPIAMIGGTPNLLVVSPNVQVKTLKAFVDYAKKHPGKLAYGTSGNGTLNNLVMEQFKHEADFEDISVPYKSMGQAITDLIGGRVQTVFPGVATALPHVRSGSVVPLATTGNKREDVLPDVPTFKELGYADIDALTWYGVVGPAGMPVPVTKKLNTEIGQILHTPDFQKKLLNLGIEPMPMTPTEFGDYIATEIAKWTRVAQQSHIQID